MATDDHNAKKRTNPEGNFKPFEEVFNKFDFANYKPKEEEGSEDIEEEEEEEENNEPLHPDAESTSPLIGSELTVKAKENTEEEKQEAEDKEDKVSEKEKEDEDMSPPQDKEEQVHKGDPMK